MPASFACPSCQTVLKTKADVPAGKKVKCPKCTTIVAVPGGAPRPAAAAVARSSGPPPLPRKPQVAAAPARSGPAPVRSGPPPATLPARKKPLRVEEDEDDRDWEDDDRPARKRSRKGKKKQGNTVLLLSCIGGGVAFLVLAFVLTAFVWPGFLRTRTPATRPAVPIAAAAANQGGFPKGTGNEDLLAFAPANCNLFAGGSLSILKDHPDIAQQFQLGLTAGLQKAGAPPELAEIFGDVERVLVAANVNTTGAPQGVFVFGMRNAYDPERTRTILQADKAQTLQGKTYYRLTKLAKGGPTDTILFMPNDRVLVIGEAPPARLAGLLNVNGVQPAVPSEVLAQVRAVDKAIAWGTVQITADMRQKLAQVNANDLAMVPELKPALPALQQLKAVSVALERLPTQKTKLTITATCANASDSQQLSSAIEKVWQKQGKFYLGMAKMGMGAQASKVLTPAINEVVNSLNFAASGPTASVSLDISDATLQQLQANAGQLQQMMGPGGIQGQPGINVNPPQGPRGRPPVVRPKRPGP